MYCFIGIVRSLAAIDGIIDPVASQNKILHFNY